MHRYAVMKLSLPMLVQNFYCWEMEMNFSSLKNKKHPNCWGHWNCLIHIVEVCDKVKKGLLHSLAQVVNWLEISDGANFGAHSRTGFEFLGSNYNSILQSNLASNCKPISSKLSKLVHSKTWHFTFMQPFHRDFWLPVPWCPQCPWVSSQLIMSNLDCWAAKEFINYWINFRQK